MNKIWFFVEGNSEEFFITNLIRKRFYENINIIKDLAEFVKTKFENLDKNICYCENCCSVDKIPHRINERNYLIKRSQTSVLIIICDIEKLICNTNRRNVILKMLNEDVDNSIIKYVFFNPMIENHYWDCLEIIKKIIEINYRNIFKKSLKSIEIPSHLSRDQKGLKYLFKHYRLKYRESNFAENFFARLDYNKCNNVVLNRLINIIKVYI